MLRPEKVEPSTWGWGRTFKKESILRHGIWLWCLESSFWEWGCHVGFLLQQWPLHPLLSHVGALWLMAHTNQDGAIEHGLLIWWPTHGCYRLSDQHMGADTWMIGLCYCVIVVDGPSIIKILLKKWSPFDLGRMSIWKLVAHQMWGWGMDCLFIKKNKINWIFDYPTRLWRSNKKAERYHD